MIGPDETHQGGCRSCRRNTGSAFATFVGYKQEQVCIVKGALQAYASSPGVVRSFCGTCGTPLSYAAERYPGEIHLYVSTLDRPEAFEPGAHVHVGEQLPWLHLDDGLPRFPTTGYNSEPLP